MDLNFRPLRADEVEARIGVVKTPSEGKKGGVALLLYKDARCDMNLLDETVGPMNWQKSYSRENRNCTVSIWDDQKGQWVSKEDTGTESNTEAEKGLASDSFKRACFNCGIGRELYTAPFIWITGAGKNDRFWVREMEVENRKITRLVICSCDQYGNRVDEVAYEYPKGKQKAQPKKEGATEAGTTDPDEKIDAKRWKIMQAEANKYGWKGKDIVKYLNVSSPSEITYQMEHDFIAVVPFLSKDDLDS